MIKELLKNIISIIPPQNRRHPSYKKMKSTLSKSFTWSKEELDKKNLIELRRMVYLAYTNTVGYRQLYKEAKVQPSDIQKLSDLSLLPTVNKDLLRDNIKDFSVSAPSHRYNTTGGTTGEPFGFYLSRWIFANEAAFVHSYWNTGGWQLGNKSIVLRGSYVGTEDSFIKCMPYTRELYFSANHLTKNNIPVFAKAAIKHKIKFIQAYPSALSLLCDYIEETNCKDFDFEALILASENIYSWQIDKFKKHFPKAKILSWYGHAEKACFASLIPDSNLQYEVNPMYGIAEAGEANENGMSEIIATGFINNATPFIRYETNDYAEFTEERPKGCLYKSSTILKKIDGRRQEVIVSKSGKYISMTSLSIHGGLYDGFKQFQFQQEKPGEVTIAFVPSKSFNNETQQLVKSQLQERFNNDIEFHLKAVENIPKTHRGKMRYLVQKLDIKYNLKK